MNLERGVLCEVQPMQRHRDTETWACSDPAAVPAWLRPSASPRRKSRRKIIPTLKLCDLRVKTGPQGHVASPPGRLPDFWLRTMALGTVSPTFKSEVSYPGQLLGPSEPHCPPAVGAGHGTVI